MSSNLQRLIQLAEATFDFRNDPDQLAVDAAVMDRLQVIHPATLAEENTAEGPIAWTLVWPTTKELMEAFLAGDLSERQLFEATPEKGEYQAIYLCSALVLPEQQRMGLAKRMLVKSIEAIRANHPITDLFFWPFSKEGERLAAVVASKLCLRIHKRAI